MSCDKKSLNLFPDRGFQFRSGSVLSSFKLLLCHFNPAASYRYVCV
jgi:hypothetical protein